MRPRVEANIDYRDRSTCSPTSSPVRGRDGERSLPTDAEVALSLDAGVEQRPTTKPELWL